MTCRRGICTRSFRHTGTRQSGHYVFWHNDVRSYISSRSTFRKKEMDIVLCVGPSACERHLDRRRSGRSCCRDKNRSLEKESLQQTLLPSQLSDTNLRYGGYRSWVNIYVCSICCWDQRQGDQATIAPHSSLLIPSCSCSHFRTLAIPCCIHRLS